VFKGLMSQDPQ